MQSSDQGTAAQNDSTDLQQVGQGKKHKKNLLPVGKWIVLCSSIVLFSCLVGDASSVYIECVALN